MAIPAIVALLLLGGCAGNQLVKNEERTDDAGKKKEEPKAAEQNIGCSHFELLDDRSISRTSHLDSYLVEMMQNDKCFRIYSYGSRDDSAADYQYAVVENLRIKIEKLEGLVKELVKEAKPRGYAEEKIGIIKKCLDPATGEWGTCVPSGFGARG